VSRTSFDQFSKQFLEELLSQIGQVQISREIPGESRLIDVYFTPEPSLSSNREDLGLLGKVASQACVFEYDWNTKLATMSNFTFQF
jgi:hypothetical protein